MKLNLIVLIVFHFSLYFTLIDASGQNHKVLPIDTMDVKSTMLKIADKILKSTNYDFIEQENGIVYSKLENIPQNVSVKLASDFNEWEYQNSLVCFGMERMNELTPNAELKTYSTRKINFLVDNFAFFSGQRQK